MNGDVVNAVADLGVGIGNELRNQALVDRLPGFARIVGAERARSGNGDVDAIRIFLVENDGVETHAAGAGLPLGAGAVSAQAGKFAPILAAVGGFEKSGVFHARVDEIRIGMGRVKVPDTLEFPGMLRAVVELMGGERRAGFLRIVVFEFVTFALGGSVRRFGFAGRRAWLEPGFAAVIGTLNDWADPAACLRAVDAIWIHGRPLQVIDLPAGEMWAADLPFFALAVGRKNKRSLARANQHSNFAHVLLLLIGAILSVQL